MAPTPSKNPTPAASVVSNFSDPIEVSDIGIYSGLYSFRRPNIYLTIAIHTRGSKLLQGVPVGDMTPLGDGILWATAILEHVVVDHPETWDLDNIFDVAVLTKVYQAYSTWVSDFRPVVESPKEEVSETTRS